MTDKQVVIKTALFSVTDKTGLEQFAISLLQMNPTLKIIASGGTAKVLEEAGISVIPLEKYTGFPECFDGRVKTLHPNIEGGILFKRGIHDEQAEELGIHAIDLVVCNLYRFEDAAKDKNLTFNDLIEFMDIGGSTLIRSSVKNHSDVTVVTDPNDYERLIEEMQSNDGAVTQKTRKHLAVKAMNLSAIYEVAISSELSSRLSGEQIIRPSLIKGQKLRYGENPDQEAWVYHLEDEVGIAQAKVISGKEQSYNNYEDANVAYNATQELSNMKVEYGVSVVKHGSLCGYSTGPNLVEAFEKAWEGDSKSAYGSVISFTQKIDESLIESLKGKFIEVIIAPGFDSNFVAWAKDKRPNLRLLEAPQKSTSRMMYKNVSGGMLVQTKKELKSINIDRLFHTHSDERVGVVTKRKPEKGSFGTYAFAIAAVNYAKSNAIVIVREWTPGYYQLIGVGSGQPNRVDSLQKSALPKAIDNLERENAGVLNYDFKKDLESCVLASDGFFPFDDSVRYAADFGIKYCLQPGGSKRDDEVIQAADELDLCMIFTGERYFTH
ncbi:MAG: bifunctional phosphoribosylaminoimidazolecarboxamide formyltransferase/IMP cyclohydrolase [Chlamydiota bacterium]|nr:bifunctional phosphoribosylaminoimidazolecarboxamide formyltransferase/IMP cyclohydrolase [Chlamydiota bacterium]